MGSPTEAVHYVVNVTIEKITVTSDSYDKTVKGRDKAEVARIVINDRDLTALKNRTMAHIDLVEDGGADNGRTGGATRSGGSSVP
jgi:hypothetical protein